MSSPTKCPYMSCGQPINRAQGSALGSLVPNHKTWFSSNPLHKKRRLSSSFKSGGQGWIRTTVVSRRQIYSLFPLATRAPTLIFLNLPLMGFEPMASPLPRECATPAPQRLKSHKGLKNKPAIGIEPTTYGLQNRCSTVELCRLTYSIL